jgi:hypothetical protein
LRSQIALGAAGTEFKELKEGHCSKTRSDPYLNSSDAMGWGQPTNGKRTRHCSDENNSEFRRNSDKLTKEMRSPFGKRHRDSSPSGEKLAAAEEAIAEPSSRTTGSSMEHEAASTSSVSAGQ